MPSELTPENIKAKSESFKATIAEAAAKDASSFRAEAEKLASAEIERVKARAKEIADRYQTAVNQIAIHAFDSFKQNLQAKAGANVLAAEFVDFETKTTKSSSAEILALKKAAKDSLAQGAPQWMGALFNTCGHFKHQCDFPDPHKDPDEGLDNVD